MSKKVLSRLTKELADDIVETSTFRGDDQAIVKKASWEKVARFLRDDDALLMNHFVDLTAADYPEREPEEPRFDVVLHMRSMKHNHRVRVKTRVGASETIASLCKVWPAADWAEREIFDMFGIRFDGHPDLRRILMYEEFEGFPLRKDYPIDRVQPLVAYRDVEGTDKLAPFGADEGQPFGRVDWASRLAGEGQQVSPALAQQVGERRSLSKAEE